jgi:antitoxin ParD1/3/4
VSFDFAFGHDARLFSFAVLAEYTNDWYILSGDFRRFHMPKNTSFSLGEHFSTFIEGQVAQGRYDNASDVIRAALRLLEEQEAKLSALRAALVEGENSGPSTAFDFDRFIARKRKNGSSAA